MDRTLLFRVLVSAHVVWISIPCSLAGKGRYATSRLAVWTLTARRCEQNPFVSEGSMNPNRERFLNEPQNVRMSLPSNSSQEKLAPGVLATPLPFLDLFDGGEILTFCGSFEECFWFGFILASLLRGFCFGTRHTL